ncbi:right-handed parallel beta-helix repeat-containing protein [Sphingomonas glacialis]|uniref:Right-handed parallel beta-helix repeat-containing protein n=1 Tax=Sphingomonas glacialis TaxID=658225 RepID=A0A502FJ60_9SPHN|nr:right-handed parallel beta-helix repeat-containing protein [Sphingomonas glacialis]TPG49485.1 right-handed parallel beta-helix repeat-containing protein [Sphingomonas glacialis]
MLAFATPGAAQLASPVAIPTYTPPAVSKAQSANAIHISSRPAPVPVVLAVTPSGSDDGDGSAARPFATLARAQVAVRRLNGDHDVTVRLADGVYRLKAPLRFTAADGGQRGFTVRWEAAPGAHPVVSGGTPVTGWTLADRQRGIWAADIPRGVDPRQLWVGGHMAPRAAVRAPRTAFRFDKSGIEIVDPTWRSLAKLPDQTRIEVEATGWFTDRHAMVARIDGDRILMQQPGWRNNLVGYDTLARSVWGDNAALFFVNALAFVRDPGQWYADPAAGKLYYKPAAGEDMARLDVVLPRLELLLSIAGSYDATIKDLQFRGLSFRHTSWLLPSGPEGYASQQSGSFLAGDWPGYPDDPVRDCSWGCRGFEAMRNRWRQQPAAIQVAAATRIVFDHDEFTELGQIALGIGNNPDANASGIGLGTSAIEVRRSRFTDLAGGAIMVGGVQPDAHHPSRSEMGVRDVVISNNLVRTVSQQYREQAAILVTYASGAVIWHNDVSAAPYDGIDIGWGWGANDPGGNAAYFTADRGYYDQPGNRVYDTPTTLRDTVVVGNRVHDVKQWFPDGGAIYHLSADPGALIAENHIYDIKDGIALYLDEGSRYVTLRNNAISNVAVWLNMNSQDQLAPRRTAMDNLAIGNWHDSGKRTGQWTPYVNNREVETVTVANGAWPDAAQAIIAKAGIEPERP